jgi:thiamine-monophosphate kinase
VAQLLYEGLLPLAGQFDVAIAGGDTNSWDGRLVVSVTLVGELTPAGPLVRSGAKSGDAIVVTGQFGGSILGHHLDFEPRVRESIWLKGHYPLHAGIDTSDGLSLDLWRLAESSGCGAVINLDAVPIAPASHQLASQRADGSTPLDHALGDGEDFELILAMPQAAARELVAAQPLGCPCKCIGQFVSERGLWQTEPNQPRRPLVPRGFEHSFNP